MGCEILNGIVGVCDYSASGIQRLWLANKGDVSVVSYDSGNTITGITLTSGSTFYEIVGALDSITFQDDLVINGYRRNYFQSVNFGVSANSAAVLKTLEEIGLSNIVAVVFTAENDYRGLGFSGAGLRTTVLTETSGNQTANDGSLNVTVAGSAKTKARFVDATVMSSYL